MSKRDWCNIPISVPWVGFRHWRDLRIWLIDNVHDMDYDAAGVDLKDYDKRVIYFARERDAAEFALRWS